MSVSVISTVSVISSVSDAGGEPGLGERVAHVGDDVGVLELLDRQVHAHRERRLAPAAASASGAAWRQASRSTQRPIGTIRPISSASGMKLSGREHAALGVMPAQQRLDAGDARRR